MTASRCPRDLQVVDGATHLFEEPGALDQVSRLAGDWFVTHMQSPMASDTRTSTDDEIRR